MSKKIIYSPYAFDCLEKITLIIAQDSKVRAENFVNKIIDKIENLTKFSELGIEIENNCRKLMINKNYKVIYEISDECVNILSVENIKMNK